MVLLLELLLLELLLLSGTGLAAAASADISSR